MEMSTPNKKFEDNNKKKSVTFFDDSPSSPRKASRRLSNVASPSPMIKRRASVAVFVPPSKNLDRSAWKQTFVLLHKRFAETIRDPIGLITYFLPTLLIMAFVVLLYVEYPSASRSQFDGNLEVCALE
jgi:hypothetical protein